MEVGDGFWASCRHLGQRLVVEVDVFPDQRPGVAVLTDEQPVGTVDVLGGDACDHLLLALVVGVVSVDPAGGVDGGEEARGIPAVGVDAVAGDVAGGVIDVATGPDGGDFVGGRGHGGCGRGALHLGQAVAGGVVGIGGGGDVFTLTRSIAS